MDQNILPVQKQLFGKAVSQLLHLSGFPLLNLYLCFQLSGALLKTINQFLEGLH